MAKYYENARKSIRKKSSSSSNENIDTRSYPKQQSDRISAQLLVNGIENPLNKDTRNPIEKALNLTPDQNFIFDAFEILGRPQQALFGAIDEGMRTGDWLGGAVKGLTGEKDTSGGQILRGFGIGDDKNGKADLSDPSTWGADDVLGFILDTVADPLDLALIPVTGGASLLAKGASTAGDVAKAVDTVSDVAKAVDNVADVAKAGNKATKFISPSDLIFNTVNKGAKQGLKLADNITGGVLSNAQDYLKGIVGSTNDKVSKTIREVTGLREGAGNDATRRAISRATSTINEVNAELPKIREKYADSLLYGSLTRTDDTLLNNLYEAFESSKQQNILRYRGAKKGTANGLEKASDLFYKVKNGSGFTPNSKELRNFLTKVRDVINSENLGEIEEFQDLVTKVKEAITTPLDRNIIMDNRTLNQLDEIVGAFPDSLSIKEINDISKNLTLKKMNPKVRLWNRIKKDFPETYEKLNTSFEQLSKGIDDDLARTLKNKNNTIKNIIGDFKGRDEAGYLTPKYSNYVRTRVQDDIAQLLSGRDFNISDFTDRKFRAMDVSTVNKQLKSMSRGELGKVFSNLDEDDVSELYEIIQEKGFYDRDFRANIMDVAKNLPSRIANAGVREDIVIGLGLENTNKQVELLKQIRNESRNFKKGKLDDTAKAVANSNIAKYKKELNDLYKDSIVRPISKIKNPGYHAVSIDDIKKSFSLSKDKNFDKLLDNIKVISGNDKEVFLDNRVYRMLKLNKESDKSANLVLDMVDKLNNIFRRNKLLSPGYNIRNITGNAFNLYVAGVPINEIPTLMAKNTRVYNLADEAIKRMAKGELLENMPENIQKAYEKIVRLEQYGFGDLRQIATEIAGTENIGERLLDTAKNPVSKAIDAVNRANVNMNIKVDNVSRLSMMEYAEKHPEYLKRMDFDNVGEAISYSLFDPSDLTDTEKNVLRKVVPFYTFTKKNLAFQMKNITKNNTRYRRVMRAIDSAWGDDDEVADYYKSGLAIPLGYNEDGTRTVFNANLPLSDLIEWTSNPLQRATSSLTPLIRAPFEMMTNQQFFTERPISSFKGEQSDLINRLPFAEYLPNAIDNQYTEYFLSQSGVDTPLKTILNLTDLAKSAINADTQNLSQDALNALGVFGVNDPTKVQLSREFDELQTLEDYKDYLTQEGIDLITVSEFEDTNKGKILQEFQTQIDTLLGRKPDKAKLPDWVDKYYSTDPTDWIK